MPLNLLYAITVLLWGSSWFAIEFQVGVVPPELSVAWRHFLAAAFLAVFCLAAAGFPGLNSFVGELLVLSGAFATQGWLGVLGIWGVALGTTYLLWLYYRVVMGERNPGLVGLRLELDTREVATLAPLALLAAGLGLWPEWVLSYLRVPVAALLATGATP